MFDELLIPLLQTEKGRRLGQIVLGCAGALLVYAVLTSLWAWKDDFFLMRDISSAASTAKSSDDTLQLIAQIPQYHLFGQAPEEDTDFLPITSLQVRLIGIMQSKDESHSEVIISSLGQMGKVYRIGGELVDGIKINNISRDGVVLEHNGHLEKLPLVRAPLLFQNKPQSLWQDNQ